MDRRALLRWTMFGLGGAALESCVELPWAQHPSLPPEELEKLLRELDARLAALRASKPQPGRFGISARDASKVADGHDAVVRTLSALHLVGTYRDLPAAAKREPRVEQRFGSSAQDVHDTVTSARDALVEMDETLRARIEERLRREPDLPMRVMEQIDDLAKGATIPLAQRTYLRTTTAQLSWRFGRQGTKAVLADLVGKYDRTLALVGAPTDGPLRVRFRTGASVADIRRAVCTLQPETEIDGQARPIDLRWDGGDELPCPRPIGPAIRGNVRAVDEGGQRVITLEIDPPPDATEETLQELRQVLVNIGTELRKRSIANANAVDVPVQCKNDEDCAKDQDCKRPLFDRFGKCVPARPGSARLVETTGRVAVVGLATFVLCVGAVILVAALFMIVAAGFMALGGN